MKHHPFTKLASILVVCLMVFSSAAFADETQLMDMVKNMQKQMTDLQSTVMAQKAELQALKAGGGGKIAMAPSGVEATPPMSEAEFNQRLSDSTGGASKWLKDLKFSGDLRLRYEAFHLKTAANNGYEPNRNRFRFRLRYGFEKTFNPEMKVGFSMASGDKAVSTGYNGDPISTNQTLGNNFDFKNIWIEKAYATYTPEWAKVGPISG
ncbi:MAG: putative porin, partial [Candidatus Omnitrophota bacterium]